MENKIGMVGMGKVVKGVMVFSDVTGKGFAKKISAPVAEVKPVVTPVVRREPAIKNEVSMVKEVLDVPSFMKNRVRPAVVVEPVVEETVVVPEPVNNVVRLDTGYQGEQSLGKEVKKALVKLNNWLWDLD